MVRKDATIRLFGGAYETDPALAGRKVECVFDPFDLTVLEIRWNGVPCRDRGPAEGRPALPPQGETRGPAAPAPRPGSTTSAIIGAEHEEAARRHRIRYDALGTGTQPADRTRTAAGGREVTAQPGSAAEISAVLAWAARLRRRPGRHHRDRRLPHRQGRRSGTHRRRARRRRLGPRRHRPPPARPRPGPARPPTPPRAGRRRHHHHGGLTNDGPEVTTTGSPGPRSARTSHPAMLHHYPAHAEAVARITWCARERALGVITGEVGAGKTVAARAAIAGSTRPATP